MSTVIICDQCGAGVGAQGIEVDVRHDDPDERTEVDLCGYACLSAWAARIAKGDNADAA